MRIGYALRGALVAVLAMSPLATPTPARADGDLVVSWPEITEFNPTHESYTFTVSDSGPGDLIAYWLGSNGEPIPHNGQYTMTFPVSGRSAVEIYRCIGKDCTPVASSPVLTVMSRLVYAMPSWDPVEHVTNAGSEYSTLPVTLFFSEFPSGVDIGWSIHAGPLADDPVLISGQQHEAESPAQQYVVDFDVPSNAVTGTPLYLRVSLSADTPVFGTLQAAIGPLKVPIDHTPPVDELFLSGDVIYPTEDGWFDTVDIRSNGFRDDTVFGEVIELVSPNGTTKVLSRRPLQRGAWVRFAAKNVPAGRYRVRLTAWDQVGNTVVHERPLRVVIGRIERRSATVVVSAKKSLVDRSVGRCSTLASPSSHRWSGSLGYYSQTSCRRPAHSAVVTAHAWWMPKSIGNYYEWASVSAYGGTARRARGAYLVMGYLRAEDGSFAKRKQLSGRLGWHRGQEVIPDPFLRTQDGRAFMVWNVGLTQGARYDVKSFRIKADRLVFVGSQRPISERATTTAPRPNIDVTTRSRALRRP